MQTSNDWRLPDASVIMRLRGLPLKQSAGGWTDGAPETARNLTE